MRSRRRWDKSVRSSSESSSPFKCVWIRRNPLKRSEDERNLSRLGIRMLLWSPMMTELISPLRLMSSPICRLISREREDIWRARSLVIMFSGDMPLWPRRSSCLICAARNPVVFPEILLMGNVLFYLLCNVCLRYNVFVISRSPDVSGRREIFSVLRFLTRLLRIFPKYPEGHYRGASRNDNLLSIIANGGQ